MNQSSDERVQTITESGEPVKERVKDAKAAYAITERLIKDNETTLYQNTRLRGMYDGNAPFDQSKRKAKGMAWMANFNTRTAERVIDEATGAQWDMFASQPRFIEANWIGDEADRVAAMKFAQLMADKYTCTLRKWPDFNYHLKLRLQEMNKMSCGPCFWPDEYCWKSESLSHDRLILPRRAKSKTSGNRFALIRGGIDVLELFESIDADDATEKGWNVAHCRKVIATAIADDNTRDPYQRGQNISWASAQDRMRNRDYSTTAQFDDVPVRHLLTTEMDGTVSHYIMYDTKTPVRGKVGAEYNYQYMFRAPSRFKSMQEVLHLLMYDIGDGYYYSIKSLLQRIFATCDLENRSVCALVNAMIMAGGLIAQPESNFNAEKLMFTNIGALTVLDPALKVLQTTSFSPPIDKSIIVRNILLDILNQNRGNPQSNSGEKSNYESDKQKEMEQQLKAHFAAVQSSWMYSQFDAWHSETIRRMLNPDYPENADGYAEAAAFKKALKDAGMPSKFIDSSLWEFTAVRAVGMGSVQERRAIANIMLKTIGGRSERARRNIMRDFDTAYLPYNMVDRYNEPDDMQQEVSWQMQMAERENNDMKHGDPATVGDNDNHGEHIPKHFEFLADMLKAFKAQPQAAPQLVQPYGIAIQHTAGHVGKASRDQTRESQVAQWTKAIKGFAAVHKAMVQVAQKIQKSQQEQQGKQQQLSESLQLGMAELDMKERLAMRELEIKEKVGMADVASLNKKRESQTEVGNTTKIATAAATIALEKQKADKKE